MLGGFPSQRACSPARRGSLAPDPDVVRDATEEIMAVVDVEDGPEAILEIVSPALVEVNAVELEPRSPEDAREAIDMARVVPAGEVAKRVARGRLHVEVDACDESQRRKVFSERVDDRIEAVSV